METMASDVSCEYCTCGLVCDTEFGGDRGRSPAFAIVEAIAAAKGVDSKSVGPIFEEIDLQALNNLFKGPPRNPDSPKILRFTYDGWNVYLRGDGAIRVCDPNQVTDPKPIFEGHKRN